MDREPPLDPVGVLGEGEAALALADRLLSMDDEALAALTGVSAPGRLFVLGDPLPWVDGVVYFGRPQAGHPLLLPTTVRPDVPDALFARALQRRGLEPHAAVWPAASLAVLPLVAAGAIDRGALEAWRCR